MCLSHPFEEHRPGSRQEQALGAAISLVGAPLDETVVEKTLYQAGDVALVAKHIPAQQAWREAGFFGDVGKGVIAGNSEIKMFQKETISKIKKQE